MTTMDQIRNSVNPLPVNPAQPAPGGRIPPGQVQAGKPFQDVLNEQLRRSELKFSAHAVERMRNRNIQLNARDVDRLKSAVDQVAAKGGNDSVLFMDNRAFLVNVKNRTVITALSNESMKENVFTNIDSALVL